MIDLRDIRFVRAASKARDFPADGPQVCFAGRSNVGKSSLLNTITGRPGLARTSKTPGRTREINFFLVAERFYMVDLPGYGYAKVSQQMRAQWGRLIEKYLTDNAALRLMVIILDARRDPNADDLELIAWVEERHVPYVIALTKSDKLSNNEYQRQSRRIGEIVRESLAGADGSSPEVRMIGFSSHTGQGKKELVNEVLAAVSVGPNQSGSMTLGAAPQ